MLKDIHEIQSKKYHWIALPCLISFFLVSFSTFAAHRVINLDIGYKTVYFTNKPARAIAVNNQI
ncbi:hypothetical protein OQJ26_18950, partial [Legionella sp. PATHC038]|uniref:hypothetical protein n=1 Tax=Legionella sheltonii TaxID=2992041 RepID=UPI0022436885